MLCVTWIQPVLMFTIYSRTPAKGISKTKWTVDSLIPPVNIVSRFTTNDISWHSCGDCCLENDILEEFKNLRGWNSLLHTHISLYSSSWQYPIYCHKQYVQCLYHFNKSVWTKQINNFHAVFWRISFSLL